MTEIKPCPLCGSSRIKFHWSGSGVGGQMMTVCAFAECEDCLTIFRETAGSTAGFGLTEVYRMWRELPQRLEWMRAANAERAAKSTGTKQASDAQRTEET